MTAEVDAQSRQQLLNFSFEGVNLSGILDLPETENPKGIILIVHGDGKTDAVAGQWYQDVRQSMLKTGYATYMWDKMGCGNSGGTYTQGRPIQNEAVEVIVAIENLKEKRIAGSHKIGLWGISRAGWINPMVIDNYQEIDFWISVSGVDDDETFNYLLAQNLRINGLSPEKVKLIVGEYHAGILLSRGGAEYEEYLSSTPNLQQNEFWLSMTNGGITEDGYYEYQKTLQEKPLDPVSELPLYVEGFEEMLTRIDIPVLALFGETDMTVDWRKAKLLYERALGPNKQLTLKTFPNCNHNMWQCQTGGINEIEEMNLGYTRCAGYLEAMTDWLKVL